MIFSIQSSTFTDENKNFLNHMALSAFHGWAFIDFDDENSAVKKWINKNNPDIWNHIKEATTKCISNFKVSNLVEVTNNQEDSNWSLDIPKIKIEEANILINKPYEIWLENGIDDKDFMLLLMPKGTKEYFIEKSDKNQIKFIGKGGLGEIKKHIIEEKNKNHIKKKVFVIFDSDKNKKNNISDQAKEVVDECKEKKLTHHYWDRRAIENYLPIEYLKEQLKSDDIDYKKYTSFLSMNQDQKYYYHMKKGLKNKSCKDSGLYDTIEKMIRENDFHEGFGKGISSKFIRLESEIEIEKIRKLIEKNDLSFEIKTLLDNLLNFTRLPK